jgi:dimethylamine corrinoid protein
MVELVKAMHALEEAKVLGLVDQRIQAKDSAIEILDDLQEGMRLIGEDFEKGNYFLSELIMSATVFKQASEKLSSILTTDASKAKYGTFLIGTVKDDIHDIGKDIVATLLACQGFNVVDLGVDVPVETFVEGVRTHKPNVLGLSCLLTTAFESMKATVDAITQAGLREGLPIIIGGATITESTCRYAGADAFCLNAHDAVNTAIRMSGGTA